MKYADYLKACLVARRALFETDCKVVILTASDVEAKEFVDTVKKIMEESGWRP